MKVAILIFGLKPRSKSVVDREHWMVSTVHSRENLAELKLAGLFNQMLLKAQADANALRSGRYTEAQDLKMLTRRIDSNSDQLRPLEPTKRYRIDALVEGTTDQVRYINLDGSLNIFRPTILLVTTELFKSLDISMVEISNPSSVEHSLAGCLR